MVCDQLMLPVANTVAPLAARYTVMSEKFAAAGVAGECDSRWTLGGERGPIASISYPRNGVPSGFATRSPFRSPVPVKTQEEASSIIMTGLDCVMNITPIIASSGRLTGAYLNSLVLR